VGGGEEPKPASSVIDFESDAIGNTYAASGGTTAEVVANPAPTAGNAQSLFYNNTNYNQVITLGTINLPTGYTLANCDSVSFDVYTETAQYKEIMIQIGNNPLWTNGLYKKISNGGWGHVSVNLHTGESTYADGITYPKDMTNVNAKGGASVSADYSDGSLTSFTLAIGINDNSLAYYLDNVVLSFNNQTGIPLVKPISQVYNTEGGIIVNANNENVSVYSIDGRLVKQTVAGQGTNIPLQRGLYIVRVGANNAAKILVK
jgi:hypothetical protein